jgi:hypothetical protein
VSDRLVDMRTPLAASEHVRIELGAGGELYVATANLTLHRPLEPTSSALLRCTSNPRKIPS